MKKLLILLGFLTFYCSIFGQYTGNKLPSGLTVANTANDADYTIIQKSGETYVKAIRMDSLRSYMTEGMAANVIELDSVAGNTGQFIISDGSGWLAPVSAKYEGNDAYTFGTRLTGAIGDFSMVIGRGTATATRAVTIGGNSTSLGAFSTYRSTASGNNSVALCNGTSSGAYALSAGSGSISSGVSSTAIGGSNVSGNNSAGINGSTVSGTSSIGINGSNVSGSNSAGINGAIVSGDRSTAINRGTASGDDSFAVGLGTVASGDRSTAWNGGVASGDYSTAWNSGDANANNSTAWGSGVANGDNSTAWIGGVASGESSTAWIGGDASGESSTAWISGTASGNYSTAWISGDASGESSTAWISGTASGDYSTAWNNGISQSYLETSFGQYVDTATIKTTDSWVATDRLLTIGNGTSGSPSNALVMLKNGNTTANGNWTFSDTIMANEGFIKNKAHGFYAFEDLAVVINCTQNTWVQITNATNDLFTAVQDNAGFTISGDTIYFSQPTLAGMVPHIVFHYGIDGYAGNNEDYEVRIFNVSNNAGVMRKSEGSTTGSANRIEIGTTAYDNQAAFGDAYILQIVNRTNNNDFTIENGSVYLEVSHY